MQRFGKPGLTLVGCDSHTPAAGALGMLAFGAGGVKVALVMAGEPLHLKMPEDGLAADDHEFPFTGNPPGGADQVLKVGTPHRPVRVDARRASWQPGPIVSAASRARRGRR